jgi:hypothetical protein
VLQDIDSIQILPGATTSVQTRLVLLFIFLVHGPEASLSGLKQLLMVGLLELSVHLTKPFYLLEIWFLPTT